MHRKRPESSSWCMTRSRTRCSSQAGFTLHIYGYYFVKKYKLAKFRKFAGKLFFKPLNSIDFISNQQLSANCDFCRSIWFRTFNFVSRSLRLCFTDRDQFFSHGGNFISPPCFLPQFCLSEQVDLGTASIFFAFLNISRIRNHLFRSDPICLVILDPKNMTKHCQVKTVFSVRFTIGYQQKL